MAPRKAKYVPADADPKTVGLCKGFHGHAWEDIPPPPNAPPPRRGFVRLHMRCWRCGNEKIYDVDRSDPGRAKPRYYHPWGYEEIKRHNRAEWKHDFMKGFKRGRKR